MPDSGDDTVKKQNQAGVQLPETDTVLSDVSLTAVEAESDVEVTPRDITVEQAAHELAASSSDTNAAQPSIPASVLAAQNQKQSGRSKKPLFIILSLVIAALLAVGIGGVVALAWYNNPQKVVTDALIGLGSQESTDIHGSLRIDAKNVLSDSVIPETTMNVPIVMKYQRDTGVAFDSDMRLKIGDFSEIKLKASYVKLLKGSDYVKVDGLSELYNTVFLDLLTDRMVESMKGVYGQVGQPTKTLSAEERASFKKMMADSAFDPIFKPILTAVDGKWIEVRADDISKVSGRDAKDSPLNACSKEMAALIADKNITKVISKSYNQHRFMIIESVDDSFEGSNAYDITVDESKYKAFQSAMEAHDTVKAYTACTDQQTDSKDTKKDKPHDDTIGKLAHKTSLRVWVHPWSHQLTRAKATSVSSASDGAKTNFAADVTFKQNKSVTIQAPKDATLVSDICGNKVVEDFCEGFFRGFNEEDGENSDSLWPSTPKGTSTGTSLPNNRKT